MDGGPATADWIAERRLEVGRAEAKNPALREANRGEDPPSDQPIEMIWGDPQVLCGLAGGEESGQVGSAGHSSLDSHPGPQTPELPESVLSGRLLT